MPSERYYIEEPLQTGKTCELKGVEFHHLARVMRSRKGDAVELVNGKGTLAQATVDHLGKKQATLRIESIHQEKKHKCRIILAQAFPKPNRLDFILEKGTELGVDSFWLFPGNLSAKKEFYPSQIERARHLTIAAMKQCGRLTLPTVDLKPPLAKWVLLDEVLPFFGDVEPEAPLFEDSSKAIRSANIPVLFFTGPESGFTEQEVESLRTFGAQGVKLHNNILRTDTASLAALSLISHWQT